MNPLIPLTLALLAACVPFLPWLKEHGIHRASLCMSVVTAASMGTLVWMSAAQDSTSIWIQDSLSLFLFGLIGLVYLCASIVSYRYLGLEQREGIVSRYQVRLYYACLHLFALAMMVTVTSNNVLLLWIGLESTTLATTMLVAFYIKDSAIEAAWKYILLCSTGIALGLIGLLILIHAAVTAGLTEQEMFSLSSLREHAALFRPDTVKWAFVFIFVGIGTKVGLAPMHTWLPDAHSKTPAPISAMLSGVLLNVAFYTLLRFKLITDLSLQSSHWTQSFFLTFGFLSIIVSAFILLIQHNYKRMLAYSSIEHMGLTAFFVGLGPVGSVAALLHMIGHALAKPLLFFGAGEIVLRWKSTKIENIQAMFATAPVTSTLFLLGLLALLGMPPSPLFFSEFFGLGAGFSQSLVLTLLVCIALAMVFIAMMRHVFAMLFSPVDIEQKPIQREKLSLNLTQTVMVFLLFLMLGVSLLFLTPEGSAALRDITRHFTLTPVP